MLNYFLKVLLVLFVSLLGFICPVFAKVSKQMQVSAQYFDDLQPQDTIESFKARYDLNTRHLHEQAYQHLPLSRNKQTDLAKAVVKRKVMIIRERQFLNAEFQKGIENLYQNAVVQYTQKQFSASQKGFEEIERLSADYKQTRNYLEKLKGATFSLSFSQSTQGGRK